MAWVRSDCGDERVDEGWLTRGVPEPMGDTGGLYICEYLNLATGALVVLMPNTGWKEAARTGHGGYQAWAIPPGQTATRWTVWTSGKRVKCSFGGSNASQDWLSVFNEMKDAIETQLGITQQASG